MVKVKGQKSGHQGQKKRKTAESSPLTTHSKACAVARPYAVRSNRRYHDTTACRPGVTGYVAGQNQRMLSS